MGVVRRALVTLRESSTWRIADRQTILKLKILHSDVKKQEPSVSIAKDSAVAKSETVMSGTRAEGISTPKIQHFVDENERLQKYLDVNWFPNVRADVREIYYGLFDHLAATNEQLWRREDEARTLRSATKNATVMHRAGELLFEITQLNDKRAEFVQEINELFGVRVREKVYT